MKTNNIVTYYEDVGLPDQEELLELWLENWRSRGFIPIVLGREDAEQSNDCTQFIQCIKSMHEAVTGKAINRYGLACYVRWLACSSLPCEESGFFVSDYDVFNAGYVFPSISFSSLTFLSGACPCFAYGSPQQFSLFCRTIVESVSRIEDIKRLFDGKNFCHYHDQEFVALNHGAYSDKFKITHSLNERYVELFTELRHYTKLVHIAASATRNFTAKNQWAAKVALAKRLLGDFTDEHMMSLNAQAYDSSM